MMLPHLIAFEWRYHTRRLTFALVVSVLCFMAFMMARTGFQANGLPVNAPYPVMQSFGLLSLWMLFTQTIFTVNGVLRDDEHRMRELVLSRPVGRAQLVVTRYLGLVLAGFTAFSLAAGLLMVIPLVMPSPGDPVAPLRVASYLSPLFTLILPTLLFVSAVLALIAGVARTAIATYVGGIVLFALYMVTALLVDSPMFAGAAPATPESLARAAWLDPFGMSAYFDQTRYWTPLERTTQLVQWRGRYLGNRVVWLLITAAVLGLAYRIVPLGHRARAVRTAGPGSSASRWWRALRGRTTRVARHATAAAPQSVYIPVPPTLRSTPHLAQLVRFEWQQLLGSWLFRVVLLLFAVVTLIEALSSLKAGEYGTRILATSGRLADAAPIGVFGTMVLLFFAADVMWRERILRVDGLVDGTPTSSASLLIAKFAALAAIPVVIAVTGLLVAVGVHLASGGQPIKPTVYLASFWYEVYPLLLLAAAVLLLHLVMPNRWVAMLLSVLLVAFIQQGDAMGAEHPMWRFTAAPRVRYSDLDGFGPATRSFAAFMAWWTTVAALLLSGAWMVWRRGTDLGFVRRLVGGWQRGRGAARARYAVGVWAVVAGGVGAALLVSTRRAEAWQSSADGMRWKADYERAYRRLDGVAQPGITHVDVRVDFEPTQRLARVRGVLTLRNQTTQPIDTVWLTVKRDVQNARFSIPGATIVRADARFGVRTVALGRALAPGDSVHLTWELTLDRGGVRAQSADIDVAANGSHLTMLEFLPTLGYRATYELIDPRERQQMQLGAGTAAMHELSAIDSLVAQQHREGVSPPWYTVHAVVSTSDDQWPLAPGDRVREWNDAGRRYAEYVVDRPIPPRFAVNSGRYAVVRAAHRGVAIELWYHPSHAANVERILAATTRTLDVMRARFHPYALRTLRLIEIPNGWPFGAFAMPGVVYLTENRGMLTDPRTEDVDLLTRRVAHEVAHQWWGHTVDPLNVRGASTIVESLAKDAEAQVVASLHGADAVVPMLAYDHDRYLAGRANESGGEHTLVTVRDQSHLVYGKGALAMHALRIALGDSAVDGVLRTLLSREGGPSGVATALELRGLLRDAAGTDTDRALVDEWFLHRVIHDLRADTASAVADGAHGYRLHAEFRAERVVTDSVGERVSAADGERLEVAVYGAGARADTLLRRDVVPVRAGRLVYDVVVGELPGRVEIDPRLLRIDRERSNNTRRVTVRREAAPVVH